MIKIRLTSLRGLFLSVFIAGLLSGCAGKSGGGDSLNGGGITNIPPKYNLSAEQTQIIKTNGNPEYLTISLNSDSGRREETWSYPVKLKKMYVFWDGARVKEQDVSNSANVSISTPNITPDNFTSATTKADIITLFGDKYILDNQSEGALQFETWYYKDKGLAVSFSGTTILLVQTVDKI